MTKVDSLDKIVGTYFAAVTAEPFAWRHRLYEPQTLTVAPGLLNGFTCPSGCGGCCPRFSLDYLSSEPRPYELALRTVTIGHVREDRMVEVWSDLQLDHDDHHCRNLQLDHDDHHCRNLDKSTGRCNVHGKQPFSCDFELIRFAMSTSTERPNRVTTRLFGRGHALLRIDGERGALCTITERDEATTSDVIRRLKRLREWCEHFGVVHRLDPIIEWAATNPVEPLTLGV